jgi:ABC exporter DevB family membrane fusion protein
MTSSIPTHTSKWKIFAFIFLALAIAGFTLQYAFRFRTNAISSPATSQTEETPTLKAVSAIGYLNPEGEIVYLSAPTFLNSFGGSRVQKLLVKEGEQVQAGQLIATLDNASNLKAELEYARVQVKIAQARLAQVKAGAKAGEIEAQKARFQAKKAELEGQIITQKHRIISLEAQLQGEKTTQQATIERLKAELHNAETECDRYHLLYQDGAVSASSYDSICLEKQTSQKSLEEAQATLTQIMTTRQAEINEAKANLNRTIATLEQEIQENKATLAEISEVRPTDVQVAQAELETAIANVNRAEETLNLAHIRAPQAGQVLKIYTRSGERINERGIISLGKTSQMNVIAEVYELDIAKVRVGQKAKITSPVFSGELEGTVTQVGLEVNRQDVVTPDPTRDVDSRVVEVRIRLNPQDSQKAKELTNLQVNVVIDLAQTNNLTNNS